MKFRPIKDILLETRAPSSEHLRRAFQDTDNKTKAFDCMEALERMGDRGGSREQYIDDLLKVAYEYYPNRKLSAFIHAYLKARVNSRPAQLSLFN